MEEQGGRQVQRRGLESEVGQGRRDALTVYCGDTVGSAVGVNFLANFY